MEIRQKNLTPRVLSVKVTQGHWNWHGSIDNLWFPIPDP